MYQQRWFHVVALLAPCLMVSCESGPSESSRFVVRDSAGVTITESFAPAWGPSEGWVVDPEPLLSIGAVAGEPTQQLHRVAGIFRAREGRIIIANGGSNELRFYSPEGDYLNHSGRSGAGPGEFQQLTAVHMLPGDSLLAFDARLTRLSVFDSNGRFVRVAELVDSSAWRPRVYMTLPDGSLITAHAVEPYSHLSLPSGFLRHPTFWIRRKLDFSPVDTLAIFPSDESLNVRDGNSATYIGVPFLRGTHAALWNGDLVLGDAERFELTRIPLNGSRSGIVRRSFALQAHTEEAIKVAGLSPLSAYVDFPETLPAFTGLVGDADGNLWVKPYDPDARESEEWTVFSPEGVWLGSVKVPRTVAVAEISRDYILALTTDDMGVEYVRMYRLQR